MKPFENLTDDQLLDQLRRAVQALPDAPQHLQRSAMALWPAPATVSLKAVAQAVYREITAVLSFDSWAMPATAAGMRSMRSPTRHLLYTAQGRDFDLRVSPSAQAVSGGFALTGQVLGPDEVGSVELTALRSATVGATTTHLTHLDAMGEFRIEGLVPGQYALTVKVGGDAIVLPPLQVGGTELDSTG